MHEACGQVIANSRYDPYGNVLSQYGTATSVFAFTGEQQDATGLTYLRSRNYSSGTGRFTTSDPSQLEANAYLYAGANPVNRTDPTGSFSMPVTGLASFVACFDFHSLNNGALGAGGFGVGITAQAAVDICKLAYSKDAWSRDFFNLSGDRPTTGHDLFGWYLFEQGDNAPLEFHADQPLTQELSRSSLVQRKRVEYYLFGETPAGQSDEYRFNMVEQAQCVADYWLDHSLKGSLPLTCVLGTAYYQIKTVDNGASVGFRVDNRTDLASGSHIAGRFSGKEYFGSVEDLIQRGQIRGDEALVDVVNQPFNGGRKVVSILRERQRGEGGEWTDFLGFSHELGGGNLSQTFVWKEKRDPCESELWWLGLLAGSGATPPGMQAWEDYRNFTIQPPETAP